MDIKERIKNIIKPSVDNNLVSFGAIIACKDNKEMIRYSYGYQDIENKIPYTDSTIIRAFSCTKTFTAVAVFKCLELGLFKLEEPISKYFPSFKNPVVSNNGKTYPAKREITIKDLLDMKAGLTYPEVDSDTGKYAIKLDAELSQNKLSTLEFIDKLGKSPLLFSPGEEYHYSFCADVLGALIIKTSGLSLREFYKKYIFNPLDLKETDFVVSKENRHRIAKGYLNIDKKLEYISHPSLGVNTTGEDNLFESGGGGLFMTLDDLNKYAQALLNKTNGILEEKTFDLMIKPKYSSNSTKINNGYTYYNLMRHMERPNECNEKTHIGEFGWDGMLGTVIVIDPKKRITFVAAFQSFNDYKWELVWKLKDEIVKYLQDK